MQPESSILIANIEGFKMLKPHVGSACGKEAWLAHEPMPLSCQAGACCRKVLMQHRPPITDLDNAC